MEELYSCKIHILCIRKSAQCLTRMKKHEKILSWIGIIGGGIAFFFFYGYIAELMR